MANLANGRMSHDMDQGGGNRECFLSGFMQRGSLTALMTLSHQPMDRWLLRSFPGTVCNTEQGWAFFKGLVGS